MLTFDKIRDFERAEKGSRKLQKMPDDIAVHMRDYIKRKQKITEKTSNDILEMENIMATIKRFFELRESKLMTAVSDTVRTGIPPENMTKDEETIFYGLVNTVKTYREKFFSDITKEEKKVMYRVKSSMPAFVGPDMNIYELKEDDIVSIPTPLNEFLLKKGFVEKIE